MLILESRKSHIYAPGQTDFDKSYAGFDHFWAFLVIFDQFWQDVVLVP